MMASTKSAGEVTVFATSNTAWLFNISELLLKLSPDTGMILLRSYSDCLYCSDRSLSSKDLRASETLHYLIIVYSVAAALLILWLFVKIVIVLTV